VRKFKKAHKLPHYWATLALQVRKFQNTDTNPAKSDYGQQALDSLTRLLDEYGEELRDAIAIVSNGDGQVNASRSQQITQYHRNRIGKLEKNISQIDEALGDQAAQQEPLEVAELKSQRKDLEYQLKDHGEKIDRRSHGVYLNRMRRKHR
jgi:ABC-type phosphate transport system auxiliary subunit